MGAESGGRHLRILAVADTHAVRGYEHAAGRLLHEAAPDLLVHAGDWTDWGRGGEGMLTVFREAIARGVRVVVVPGNHDAWGNAERPEEEVPGIENIHLRVVAVGDVSFFGVGYGKRVPSWPVRLAADALTATARARVLVAHEPPVGWRDPVRPHEAGNEANVREIIDLVEPDLAIVGHLHVDQPVETRIGRTRVVNPGPNGTVLDV